MRAFLLVVFIFLFSSVITVAQISRGGLPQKIVHLKSATVPIIEMPSFDFELIKKSATTEQTSTNKLKPFKFAHAFEVSLTTENSGEWFVAENGIYCWKLKIHSEGAKSINLIFDHFKLPNSARLFIFSEKENYVLGAFTSANNKVSGKFAVSPVAGDEITVQYEIPYEYISENSFEIIRVNHDFIGILKSDDRRPLGKIAGACNIDVNCELGDEWSEIKNSACRLLVDGVELCSGALINNTAEDQKPYIISAAHCYDRWEYAETTVYVFNYESPFCAPLDGDPINSISGAIMRAQFDSMDFSLAELSLVPPPDFRPFYAGWERSVELPDLTMSIHHPQGDIKKIAISFKDSIIISDFDRGYTKNGFLKILRWEHGVTEAGSSGGPLLNMDKNIIGTLTGGAAYCGDPINDYFERFALSWNYRSEDSLQLKHWLDPLNSDVQALAGNQFYEDEKHCGAFTNLNDNDKYELVTIDMTGPFAGYWGGTNSTGVTEFVEQFSIAGNEQLSGISLGVGKIITADSNSDSEITIKVYEGGELPEGVIYSKKILIKDLYEGAMNFIGFDKIVVEPTDTFFVGFELSNMQPLDSFVVYQSLRPPNTDNFFYFKLNENWENFDDYTWGYNSMVNVFELVACNIDDSPSDTPIVDNPLEIFVFPNPVQSVVTMAAGKDISEENISVVNLIGQNVVVKISKIHERKVDIDLTGNVPGVYFIRFNNGEDFVSKKISFVPW